VGTDVVYVTRGGADKIVKVAKVDGTFTDEVSFSQHAVAARERRGRLVWTEMPWRFTRPVPGAIRSAQSGTVSTLYQATENLAGLAVDGKRHLHDERRPTRARRSFAVTFDAKVDASRRSLANRFARCRSPSTRRSV